jgi:selenocysteine-specific elongation factor
VRKAGTTPTPLPEPLREGLEKVQAMLADAPFAAPDAARLRELALDDPALALLHRRGDLLRVADGVVLLPGADDLAVHRLAELPQPFPVRAAREALGTSRRVVLPLLAHLDRTGRTVRLADDTRRVRGPA